MTVPADPTITQVLNATGKSSDGIVSRWINRPLSRLISRPLLLIPGVRPGHATSLTAAVGVAMLCCLLTRSDAGLIGGGLLFQAASVIDGVDGEIARATFRSSARGAMLDTAVDMVINVGFIVGLTVSLSALYGPVHAALGASAIALILSGLLVLAWLARRVGDPGNFNVIKIFYRRNFPTGPAARITDALVLVTSRDFFALLFALLIVIGTGQSIPVLLNGFALLWFALTLFSIRPILRGCAPAVRLIGAKRELRRQAA
jgi:CDP-L-myo-inositol myo-inositolphosphotransferase